MSVEDAREFLSKFKNAVPKIFEFKKHVELYALRNGYITTPFGRRLQPLELVRPIKPTDRSNAAWKLTNYIIQATASDIIKLSLVKTRSELDRAGLTPFYDTIFTVHDEIVMEVDNDKLDDVIQVCMSSVNVSPMVGWPVPMVADPEVGPSWGELKEYKL